MIHCGDNRSILPTLKADSVALVVTSPPYDTPKDALRSYGGGYAWDFDAVVPMLWRVLVPGGVVAWVVGDRIINGSRQLNPERQAMAFADAGWCIHDQVIWTKPAPAMKRDNCMTPGYETVIVASKGKPRHVDVERVPLKYPRSKNRVFKCRNNVGERRSERTMDGGIETKPITNVWSFAVGFNHSAKDAYVFEHPAVMPEGLAARCIRTWSKEGDTVLDPFAGSGTTLAMARKLGRKPLGIEISPEYVALIERRMADAEDLLTMENTA